MLRTTHVCKVSHFFQSNCDCKSLIHCQANDRFPECPTCHRSTFWEILPITQWGGVSNRYYSYHTFPLSDAPFIPKDWIGNYIFAKQSPDGKWSAVKIGEGELRNRYECAQRKGCVSDKGATHYHFHTDYGRKEDKPDRVAEERDLIDGHLECLEPKGCNKRKQ